MEDTIIPTPTTANIDRKALPMTDLGEALRSKNVLYSIRV